MAGVFAVDGIWYNVALPDGALSRDVEILDGSEAGRMKAGNMEFDTIGTYYNYTLSVKCKDFDVDSYAALHAVLRNPSNRKHTITIPFDQGYTTYRAYISGLSDSLRKVRSGVYYWDDLDISFVACEPNETP